MNRSKSPTTVRGEAFFADLRALMEKHDCKIIISIDHPPASANGHDDVAFGVSFNDSIIEHWHGDMENGPLTEEKILSSKTIR